MPASDLFHNGGPGPQTDDWLRYVEPVEPIAGHRKTESQFRLAQLVRKRTVMSIQEASAVTRRQPDTLRRAVRQLSRTGILEWVGGRERFQLAAHAAWAIGVVFESDRVVALAFDLAFGFVDHEAIEIPNVACHDEPEAAFEAAATLIGQMLEANERPGACLGVGLAVPTPIDTNGTCRSRLAGAWHLTQPAAQVSALVADRLDSGAIAPPIAADNASSVGALGIYLRRFSAPDNPVEIPRDLVYVRVSEQIGVGLVMKGKFVRGGHGLAGEIVHRPSPDGLACPRCGRRCLETLCSTTAIERAVNRHLNLPDPGAPLSSDDAHAVMGRRLAALIAEFDHLGQRERKTLERAVFDAGRKLGIALADVCMLVDPSLIVLGGPLARDADVAAMWVEGVRETVASRALPMYDVDREQRPIVTAISPSALPLPELRGAAGLVIQRHADAWLWWTIERLPIAKG